MSELRYALQERNQRCELSGKCSLNSVANGCPEHFHGKLRDELLAREQFDVSRETKVRIRRRRRRATAVRTHSAAV